MNHTVHTAAMMDRHRAAQLDRENEIRRLQAERPVIERPRPEPEVHHGRLWHWAERLHLAPRSGGPHPAH